MTVPIISYGHVVLRQVCSDVDLDDPCLTSIMTNLTDTMDEAEGVGLAGPQINEPIKMFLVDTRQIYERLNDADRSALFPECEGIREIFMNARIIHQSAETYTDQEGCLSIPSVYEEIERAWSIKIEYLDSNFRQQTGTFSGYTARAIQHEVDHTQGIMFIDHLHPLKRKLLKTKLRKVAEGSILINYAMQFTW